jgi:hypothetical protein
VESNLAVDRALPAHHLLSGRQSGGAVAVHSGIKAHGLNCVMRHPLYLQGLNRLLSCLAANWVLPKAFQVGPLAVGQISKGFQGQSFLPHDGRCVGYCQSVRHRLSLHLFSVGAAGRAAQDQLGQKGAIPASDT